MHGERVDTSLGIDLITPPSLRSEATLVTGMAVAMTTEGPKESVYETREPRVL